LILALDELSRENWVELRFYGCVRGIQSYAGARRSLFRVKRTLAEVGVSLAVKTENKVISARFSTPEIRELVEEGLRTARELVERLDARREGTDPALEGLEREAELVNPQEIVRDFRDRLKSHAWIARKYGIGIKRVRRILASVRPLTRPEVRRVEHRRAKDAVKRALEAADRGALLEEIAKMLGCSTRTARRFVLRNGRKLPRGRRHGSKLARPKDRNEVAS
jgi:hypothetical protein